MVFRLAIRSYNLLSLTGTIIDFTLFSELENMVGRENMINSKVDSRKTVADCELAGKSYFTGSFKIRFIKTDAHWVLLSPHLYFNMVL
ncbi:hypothetical protein EO244_00810 [Ancylomarina salipaludis]|uniref:Uncharacterized protein n=1 Tax=Ancylomarina salipaludis TaxID=2501299 RepID=A0A4Q1JPY8_9BACT|nr:hypothetical protein EO244_00810 [Ancylomarina salipaludis]